MRAIDANVVVRLITRDDTRQAASAESFVEGGVWVSVLALAEATWVLASVYNLSSNDLAKAIEMLLTGIWLCRTLKRLGRHWSCFAENRRLAFQIA